jgi:hypothetical protein
MLITRSKLNGIILTLLDVLDAEEIHSNLALEFKAGLKHETHEGDIISLKHAGLNPNVYTIDYLIKSAVTPITIKVESEPAKVVYKIRCSEKIPGFDYHPPELSEDNYHSTDIFGNRTWYKKTDFASIFTAKDDLRDFARGE